MMKNTVRHAVNLTGWTLTSRRTHTTCRFHLRLGGHRQVRVHTGRGRSRRTDQHVPGRPRFVHRLLRRPPPQFPSGRREWAGNGAVPQIDVHPGTVPGGDGARGVEPQTRVGVWHTDGYGWDVPPFPLPAKTWN